MSAVVVRHGRVNSGSTERRLELGRLTRLVAPGIIPATRPNGATQSKPLPPGETWWLRHGLGVWRELPPVAAICADRPAAAASRVVLQVLSKVARQCESVRRRFPSAGLSPRTIPKSSAFYKARLAKRDRGGAHPEISQRAALTCWYLVPEQMPGESRRVHLRAAAPAACR